MQGSANINLMIKAARKAGRSLNKDFREVEQLQVGARGPEDFTTRANTAARDIIHAELTEPRPNYGWLDEETGETPGTDPTRRWIVDPLGGAANYLHGIPHWAVSIALEHKGEIVSAVIYDAPKDELFWAEKGTGAWLGDRSRLRVSGRTALIDAVYATGLPGAGQKYLPAALQDLARLLPVCAGVRQWGAAALDLAYVAAGRTDGYWNRGLKPWHSAAGLLIAREAGAFTQPIRDDQHLLADGHIIAGSEASFDKFARIIRDRD